MVAAALKSAIPYDAQNHFPLENIPFGAFINPQSNQTHVATRIGNTVVDLAVLESNGVFNGPHFSSLTRKDIFSQSGCNDFMDLGKDFWHEARVTIQGFFAEGNEIPAAIKEQGLFEASTIKMVLPAKIGDYTDFYSSKNHAYNVGCMFRGPDNALQPNWVHMPIGYHGRASSVTVSGVPVRRPKGQVTAD